jgi:hypothetical protein
MMREVRLLRKAVEDVADGQRFYERQAPGLASLSALWRGLFLVEKRVFTRWLSLEPPDCRATAPVALQPELCIRRYCSKARCSFLGGRYFRKAINEDLRSLLISAGVHSVVYGLRRCLSKRFPYAIFYDVKGDLVLVYAILDCRRNPDDLRRRLHGG